MNTKTSLLDVKKADLSTTASYALKESYKNYKTIVAKLCNTETPNRIAVVEIPTASIIESTEVYCVSGMYNTSNFMAVSFVFTDETHIQFKGFTATGWTINAFYLDGIR